MRLLPPALALLALAPTVALAQDDCDAWGEVSPDERTVYLGEFVEFRVSGGRSCGDVDTCSWYSDDDLGFFQDEVGSPVTWQAPAEIDECLPITFRVYAECTDGDTLGWSNVTVRCTDAQLDALNGSRDASVGGGGCGSEATTTSTGAAAATLLLLPLGLVRRRRR